MSVGAGIGSAIGGIAGLGSSLFGNSNSGGSSQQTQSSAPWAPQQNYILGAMQDAQNIYSNRLGAGPYSGNFIAGNNQDQNNAVATAAGWNQGTGASIPGSVAGTASTLSSAAPSYVNNAENLASSGISGPNAGLYGTLQNYGTGASTTQGANPALSSALNSAAVNGANSLDQFNSGLQSAASRASTDPTQQILSDANGYVNSPAVQGAITAANNQISNTLNEQTIPGINREAAMGGALNSSRAGMANAMAQNAAALDIGSTDAGIANNAFNTGVGTSANTWGQGLNSSIYANMYGGNLANSSAQETAAQQQGLNEFNTSNELGAANSGLSQGLNYSLGNANTILGANNQLGSATGMGINGSTAATNDALLNYELGSGAGTLEQQGAQNNLYNYYDMWNEANTYPQQVLQNYWGIVGQPEGGSSTSNTSSTLPPNYMGSTLGGALAGYGLYQQIGGTNANSAYDGVTAGVTGVGGANTLQSLGLYNPIS